MRQVTSDHRKMNSIFNDQARRSGVGGKGDSLSRARGFLGGRKCLEQFFEEPKDFLQHSKKTKARKFLFRVS